MNKLKNNPPVPLYYTLVKYLKDQIDNQQLMPGDMIPSERELIQKFKLSRTTVRKAIDILVNEKLLFKIQGKGTFVENKKINEELIKLTSCTENIKNMGLTPSRKCLNSYIDLPTNLIMSKLGLKCGDKVFHIERVLYGDDIPINITQSNIVYKFCSGIEIYDFEKESLYNILEKNFNIKISYSIRSIEAILADENDAKLLNINKGSPMILFNGLVYGKIGEQEIPIEYFISKYRCDKTKFYIEQVR